MPEMTPADLRLAIARAKGWKEVGPGGACLVVPPEGDPRRNWAAEWDENGFPDWMENWPADITAAWELVDDARAAKMNVHIEAEAEECFCLFYPPELDESKEAQGIGETAPLAICRAWLAWKGLDNAR